MSTEIVENSLRELFQSRKTPRSIARGKAVGKVVGGAPGGASRGPDAGERRASLASIWATRTLPMQRAARPPRSITHISKGKSTFFSKTARSRFKT